MKRTVSVVCVLSAPNCSLVVKFLKEMPVSVASGTHCINKYEPVPEEAHYCMVLLLQQYCLMFVNSCNLEF